MLFNVALASSALFVAAARAQLGKATVQNLCPNTVYVANTPSADGVHQTQYATLETGQSYEQTYTELLNGNGWSIKLSYSPDSFGSNIMQYEYTYQGNGIVWFDLSKVNGNPFGWFWNISSSENSCTVSQKAYLFSDDNSAMQPSCSDGTDVTVTLCQWPDLAVAEANGVSSLANGISSLANGLGSLLGGSDSTETSSAAPTTSSTTTSTTPAPAPTTTSTSTTPAPAPTTSTAAAPAPAAPPANTPAPLGYSDQGDGAIAPGFAAPHFDDNAADNAAAAASTPTTLATSTLSSPVEETEDGDVAIVWVTDIVTEHVTLTTQYATATPAAKRHEHHPHGHAGVRF